MKKIFAAIDKLEEYIIVVLLSAMIIAVFTQVVSRFIFKNSLSWTEETARYLLVWATFIGASLGVKKGAHIGVEAFTLILPPRARRIVEYIALGLCALFSIVVFGESLTIIQKQITMGQISPAMQIPMWIPYIAVSVGTFLMTVRFVEAMLNLREKSVQGGTN